MTLSNTLKYSIDPSPLQNVGKSKHSLITGFWTKSGASRRMPEAAADVRERSSRGSVMARKDHAWDAPLTDR